MSYESLGHAHFTGTDNQRHVQWLKTLLRNGELRNIHRNYPSEGQWIESLIHSKLAWLGRNLHKGLPVNTVKQFSKISSLIMKLNHKTLKIDDVPTFIKDNFPQGRRSVGKKMHDTIKMHMKQTKQENAEEKIFVVPEWLTNRKLLPKKPPGVPVPEWLKDS